MYKKFFMGIAAMAALTLVSCSSDDLNSLSDNSSKNEAISFDGYLGRSAVAVNGSRGSVLDINALKASTEGFGVFGNYSTGGQKFGANLFDNQLVTYSSTELKWKYSPLKYWPTDGHVDFLAYAPRVDNKQLTGSSIGFTVEGDAANQKDLLWANADDRTKEKGKVTFKFNHALSRLGYTVKLNGAYSDVTIKLNKITLAGSNDGKGTNKAFYKEGSIDLYTGAWKTSTSDEKQDFEWFTNTDGTQLTTKVTDNADNYLFVIPQNFSAPATDKLYVIVEYTITYSDNTTVKTKVCKQLEKEFLQGKAYTINLTIGLTPIDFDADVTPWDPTTGTPIDASWN